MSSAFFAPARLSVACRSRGLRLCVGLAAAPWLLVSQASAQQSASSDVTTAEPSSVEQVSIEPTTEPATELDPLVVSATLSPRTASQSLSSVSVIDEEALRRRDPVSITDALRGQPGVDISTNGGFGKQASVYIRGTGSTASVMMIDGIRLRSATNGGPAWQYLEPRMFERIEVVRGPRGALYGADAVGGVVQLFTDKPDEQGPTPSVQLGTGSFNTQRASASLSGREGGTSYQFSATRLDSDGTEIRDGGEDKAYDNTSGLVSLSHTFDNGANLGLLGLRARGNNEYEGGDSDYVQQVAGVYAEVPVTDIWSSRLTLSEARDELEDHSEPNDFGPGSTTEFDTETHTVRWDNTLQLGAHELIAGAEYLEDKVDSTTDYEETSRDNVAVFAQALMDFHPFSLQAGLRHDDNEAYDEEVTGHLALGYALDDQHTLRASYGTAFRAPTFNELYFPGFGNSDLEPEESETWELGLRGQYQRLYWDLALYQTNVDDLIANESRDGRFAPFNVDEARIRGIELATGLELDQWTLAASVAYTDPEDRDTGKQLIRRASQTLRLDADRQLGDWNLGASFIAQDHRYNDVDNDERLAGYGTLDLRAGWAFAPDWKANLTLENVFDREYATSRASAFQGGWDYENPGRAAYLSVGFNL
ncbi:MULTISPECIES: TonB-dependent receptor [unclassified Halomonas]|uniref:TonB-dependent receptor domain-containing protein n=1 Tax=unclassified Halomonas TaxID=2609666 RepID=UPI000C96BD1A|nr:MULTISPECIES: TonB-dependent receptor [unclassified Halomonas]MAR73288.1 TonB-dependent receptor [Halomonas sp.]MBR9880993.1 TonB-dependent receptor [Gammaproteobacteria bacterium]